MKNLILFIATLISSISFGQNSMLKYLTNDSVKYWDIGGYGYYFSMNKVWSDFNIDAQYKRINTLDEYRPFTIDKKYELRSDSLILLYYSSLSKDWLIFENYKILHLNNDSLYLQQNSDVDVWNTDQTKIIGWKTEKRKILFRPSNNQIDVPKTGKELYPNDEKKWENGDTSNWVFKLGLKK